MSGTIFIDKIKMETALNVEANTEQVNNIQIARHTLVVQHQLK